VYSLLHLDKQLQNNKWIVHYEETSQNLALECCSVDHKKFFIRAEKKICLQQSHHITIVAFAGSANY
jgi:hypothetical protein